MTTLSFASLASSFVALAKFGDMGTGLRPGALVWQQPAEPIHEIDFFEAYPVPANKDWWAKDKDKPNKTRRKKSKSPSKPREPMSSYMMGLPFNESGAVRAESRASSARFRSRTAIEARSIIVHQQQYFSGKDSDGVEGSEENQSFSEAPMQGHSMRAPPPLTQPTNSSSASLSDRLSNASPLLSPTATLPPQLTCKHSPASPTTPDQPHPPPAQLDPHSSNLPPQIVISCEIQVLDAAFRVQGCLEERGYRAAVFESIQGRPAWQAVRDAICACQVFIPLCSHGYASPHTSEDDGAPLPSWTRRELDLAINPKAAPPAPAAQPTRRSRQGPASASSSAPPAPTRLIMPIWHSGPWPPPGAGQALGRSLYLPNSGQPLAEAPDFDLVLEQLLYVLRRHGVYPVPLLLPPRRRTTQEEEEEEDSDTQEA